MIAFATELQEFLAFAGPACEEAFVAEMDKIAVKQRTLEMLQRANRAQRGRGLGVFTPGKARKPTIKIDTQQGSSRATSAVRDSAVRDFLGTSSVQRAALGPGRMAPPISAPPRTFTSSTGRMVGDKATRPASAVRGGVPKSLSLTDDSAGIWMSPELRGALDSPPSMLLPKGKPTAPKPAPAPKADLTGEDLLRSQGFDIPRRVTPTAPRGEAPPSADDLLAAWNRRSAAMSPAQTARPRVPATASSPQGVTGARPGGAPAAQEAAEQTARGGRPQPGDAARTPDRMAIAPDGTPVRPRAQGAGEVSDDALREITKKVTAGNATPAEMGIYTSNVDRAEALAKVPRPTAKPSPGVKPEPAGVSTPKPEPAGASTPTPTPEGVSTPPPTVRERVADSVRGTTEAAREKMQQATTFFDEAIKNPTKENMARVNQVLRDIRADPSILGRAAGEKIEQVGQGARAVTEAVESVRYGVSPELLGGIKTIRNTADEFASVSRQLDELGPKMGPGGKLTQTRAGWSYGAEAKKAEQQLVDDLVDKKNQLARTMMDNSSANPGLKGAVDDFIKNPSDEAIARLNSDAIFTTAGGRPMDPKAAALIEDVMRTIIPPSSAAKGADGAAEGLAAALKDMDPAYLAAAAGAAGLGTGMVLG